MYAPIVTGLLRRDQLIMRRVPYAQEPCYGLAVASPSDSLMCRVKSWLSPFKANGGWLRGFTLFRIFFEHFPRDAANDHAYQQGRQEGIAALDPEEVAAKVQLARHQKRSRDQQPQ